MQLRVAVITLLLHLVATAAQDGDENGFRMVHLGCYKLTKSHAEGDAFTTIQPMYTHSIRSSNTPDLPPACARFCSAKGFRLSATARGFCSCYRSIEFLVLDTKENCRPCGAYMCSWGTQDHGGSVYSKIGIDKSLQPSRRCINGSWNNELGGNRKSGPWIRVREKFEQLLKTDTQYSQHIMGIWRDSTRRYLVNETTCRRKCELLRQCWGFALVNSTFSDSIFDSCILLDSTVTKIIFLGPAQRAQKYITRYTAYQCDGSAEHGPAATNSLTGTPEMEFIGCYEYRYPGSPLALYRHSVMPKSSNDSMVSTLPPACARFCAVKGFRLSATKNAFCACYTSTQLRRQTVVPWHCRPCGKYMCSIGNDTYGGSLYNSTGFPEPIKPDPRCNVGRWNDELKGVEQSNNGWKRMPWLMGNGLYAAVFNNYTQFTEHLLWFRKFDWTKDIPSDTAATCRRQCEQLNQCWSFALVKAPFPYQVAVCILLDEWATLNVNLRNMSTADAPNASVEYWKWICGGSAEPTARTINVDDAIQMEHVGCFRLHSSFNSIQINDSLISEAPVYRHNLEIKHSSSHFASLAPPTCARFCAAKGFRLSGTTKLICSCFSSIGSLMQVADGICHSCGEYICTKEPLPTRISVYNSTEVDESLQPQHRCSNGNWKDELKKVEPLGTGRRWMPWLMHEAIHKAATYSLNSPNIMSVLLETAASDALKVTSCRRKCELLSQCWGFAVVKYLQGFSFGNSSGSCVLLDERAMKNITLHNVSSSADPDVSVEYWSFHCSTSDESGTDQATTTAEDLISLTSEDTQAGSTETSMPGSTETSMPGSTKTSMLGSTETSMLGSTETSMPGSTETSMLGSTETSMLGSTETSKPASTETSMPGSTMTSMLSSTETSMLGSTETSMPGSPETSIPGSTSTPVTQMSPTVSTETPQIETPRMQFVGCYSFQLRDIKKNQSRISPVQLYTHRFGGWAPGADSELSEADRPPACARFCAAKGFRLSGTTKDACSCFTFVGPPMQLHPEVCYPCGDFNCSIKSVLQGASVYNSTPVDESLQPPSRCSRGRWKDELSGDEQPGSGRRWMPWLINIGIYKAADRSYHRRYTENVMWMREQVLHSEWKPANVTSCRRNCQLLSQCWAFAVTKTLSPEGVVQTSACILLDKRAVTRTTLKSVAFPAANYMAIDYWTWSCNTTAPTEEFETPETPSNEISLPTSSATPTPAFPETSSTAETRVITASTQTAQAASTEMSGATPDEEIELESSETSGSQSTESSRVKPTKTSGAALNETRELTSTEASEGESTEESETEASEVTPKETRRVMSTEAAGQQQSTEKPMSTSADKSTIPTPGTPGMQYVGCYEFPEPLSESNSLMSIVPVYGHQLIPRDSNISIKRIDRNTPGLPPACARFCAAKGFRLSATARGFCSCYRSIEFPMRENKGNCRPCGAYMCSWSTDRYGGSVYNSTGVDESLQPSRRCSSGSWKDELKGVEQLNQGWKWMPWLIDNGIIQAASIYYTQFTEHVLWVRRRYSHEDFNSVNVTSCRRKCELLNQCWGFAVVKRIYTAGIVDASGCILLDERAINNMTLLNVNIPIEKQTTIAYWTWRSNGSQCRGTDTRPAASEAAGSATTSIVTSTTASTEPSTTNDFTDADDYDITETPDNATNHLEEW